MEAWWDLKCPMALMFLRPETFIRESHSLLHHLLTHSCFTLPPPPVSLFPMLPFPANPTFFLRFPLQPPWLWIASKDILHKTRKARKWFWQEFQGNHIQISEPLTNRWSFNPWSVSVHVPERKGRMLQGTKSVDDLHSSPESLISTGRPSLPLLEVLQLTVPDISLTLPTDINSDILDVNTPNNLDLFVCWHRSAKRQLLQPTCSN